MSGKMQKFGKRYKNGITINDNAIFRGSNLLTKRETQLDVPVTKKKPHNLITQAAPCLTGSMNHTTQTRRNGQLNPDFELVPELAH